MKGLTVLGLAKIQADRRVTIPEDVFKKVGLTTGDKIVFASCENGTVCIYKSNGGV